MNIAIVGCGFVSDYYFATLKNYPHLKVKMVYDRRPERTEAAAKLLGVPGAESLDQLLQAEGVELVVNLTNPRDHYTVSKACLEAGKHVYSEKPFAMELNKCRELLELAQSKGLRIASAPCSLLSESAQTMKKALDDGKIGKVRLVYAEMDDGPIYHMKPETWTSASGHPWPIKDEYEVGCTLEHVGYCLNWLVGIFGEVASVHAFADCLIADKGHGPLEPADTPDFSVATLKFKSGVVARITCSIIAPHNHEIKVIGDGGVLKIDECWHYGSPVKLQKASLRAHKAERYSWIRNSKILGAILGLRFKTLPFLKAPDSKMKWKKDYMDYARGIDDLVKAIGGQPNAMMSNEFSLHVNEVALAIHYAKEHGQPYQTQTGFSQDGSSL